LAISSLTYIEHLSKHAYLVFLDFLGVEIVLLTLEKVIGQLAQV
jgi:hypothetical protein